MKYTNMYITLQIVLRDIFNCWAENCHNCRIIVTAVWLLSQL